MEHYIIILFGAIFSFGSGYVTWLSWKDARLAFNLIAKLDSKVSGLKQEIEMLKDKNNDEILKS